MRSALVIGGAGFLGSHIVDQLLKNGGYNVTVFDIQDPSDDARFDGVTYMKGSIVDATSIENVMKEIQPLVVLHTASPVHGLPDKIYYDVNEKGTQNVISACQAAGVKKLIYTSSTGVVWTGADFNGVNENSVAFPSKGYDAYHHTKALGERLILAAEGRGGMQTAILRPCGMTGERDKQLIWRMVEVYEKRQHTIQIGDNTNLVDYAYAGNIALAHVLAAEKLISQPEELGDDGKARITTIPRFVGLIMATLAELWCRISGSSTQFTRFSVRFLTGTQWYNIDKARNVLGYKPTVTVEEGIKRTVKWWKETGAAQHEVRMGKA
ncbi:hypothetical protein MSAN_00354300 [Mycena sanguinolenta]|uniref:3-beta hydroxysteroid dehydrogenase/isomerase domain-containing protein n=1 Tax=Mycena sanguinolenta TaxID=230812 RepID=A0A8H6Z9A5_9AGAR|nr:hypothetical protein MSAN_00354300 [Mycena sanguinolenta]